MSSAPRRWAAAAALVTVGWLVTPQAVPIFDGVGQPDEPYRYVAPPAHYKKTKPATTATGTSPLSGGRNTNGMSVQTAEVGPQASLFVPPQALAATPPGDVSVTTAPKAPDTQPSGATIDGNVYAITIDHKVGPVTLTDAAAISTLYLRATTAAQPGPVMEYRKASTDPWKELKTSRGGNDIYVSSFVGAGDYALAFSDSARPASGTKSSAVYLVAGVGVLLLIVVIVVRLQSGTSSA